MPTKRTHKKAVTRTGAWKPVFIQVLAKFGIVSVAAEHAGIDRVTAYKTKGRDAAFAKQWADALSQAGDLLESEARRRAVDGVAKPVFHQGKKCGSIQEYSDTLLIFLLKGNKPKKFRENIKQTIAGTIKTHSTHNIDLSGFTDDELLRFERAFASGPGGTGTPGRN